MLYSLLSASAILLAAVQGQGPPANGGAAQPPATGVTPTNPNIQPVTPVTPQQPPATPQYGYPPQPGFGGMPPFGGIMPGLRDPKVLTCEFGQCINRKITMTPGQGFKLECNQPAQCNGLDLTLNIGVDPTNFGNQVNEINDLNFDAPQTGVTVRLNNMMMQNIEMNNINCKVFGACRNMKILAGYGVELWEVNVKCEMPGACTGCTINGQSCEMISMMTGNNGGGLAYGFGYMNQPNVPQQPGTGFGAPQQPQQPGFGAPGMGQPAYPQYPPMGYPNPMWI